MTDDCTFLDKDTSFRGEICTREIIVAGSVCGEVEASSAVMIRNGATVAGPIRTARILLEEGGTHLGKLNFDCPARPHGGRSFISRLFRSEDQRRHRFPGLAASAPAASPEPAGSISTDSGRRQAPPADENPAVVSDDAPEKKDPETGKKENWSEQLW